MQKTESFILYSEMQDLNRAAISYIGGIIKEGMKLRDVKTLCEEYLLKNGADSICFSCILR